MSERSLPRADLEHVLAHTGAVWEQLRGRTILITGATGFVGTWLAETLCCASRELGVGVRAILLARRPAPAHLAADPSVVVHQADLLSDPLPDGAIHGIIHAATAPYGSPDAGEPLARLELDTRGTRRVLELARERGASVLLTSSGAIYGRQPPGMRHLDEQHRGAPDPTDVGALYAHGRRAAELLCALYHRQHGVAATIARGFSFVGPHLPLRARFAIGNFIADALDGGPIRVQGDGTARRSYLYAADLAIWLWTLLARGTPGRAYNVGSELDLSISELAHEVARAIAPSAAIEIACTPRAAELPDRYVPSTRRAREELALVQHISLQDAILRTATWHRQQRGG